MDFSLLRIVTRSLPHCKAIGSCHVTLQEAKADSSAGAVIEHRGKQRKNQWGGRQLGGIWELGWLCERAEKQQHKGFMAPRQCRGHDGEPALWDVLIRKQPHAGLPAESQPGQTSVLFPIKETETSHHLLLRLLFGCWAFLHWGATADSSLQHHQASGRLSPWKHTCPKGGNVLWLCKPCPGWQETGSYRKGGKGKIPAQTFSFGHKSLLSSRTCWCTTHSPTWL